MARSSFNTYRWMTSAAAVLLVGFLGWFLIVPIAHVVAKGFVADGQVSLYWFERVLSNPTRLREFANGLILACITTSCAMALGIPLALLRTRCQFRGQGILNILVMLPLVLPPFVGGLAMRRLFGPYGVVNLFLEQVGLLDLSAAIPPDWLGSGFTGVVLLQVLHLFPITYLNASAALANIDPSYVQAARNLGAGPWRTFWRITLPLIRPGLFAGGTIVFIWSFTDIGTPLIMGYQDLIPVTFFKGVARGDTSGHLYAMVFLMLIMSVVLYVAGKFIFGRSDNVQSSKASLQAETVRLGYLGTAGAWCLFGVVIMASLLPHLGVILTAVSARWGQTVLPSAYTFDHLRTVLSDSTAGRAMYNSFRYAGTSTILDVLLGCLAAWLIVRTRMRGRALIDALVMLPLAVPGLILAAGYVAMTAPGKLLEGIGPTNNPFTLLVIAYAVRRLPFIVRGVAAGLQQVPESLEEAARNLGCSRIGTALRITAPLIVASIIAAGVLTFAFAMLEVSDSLILAQLPRDYPITKEIYSQAASGNVNANNLAAALGVYGMVILAGGMTLASVLLGRRLGAIFRA